MPYVAFLHTHKLVVVLFLLIYLVKTFFLVSGKTDTLGKFSKRIKVPEIIISTLFLVTGAYMLYQKYPALEGMNLTYTIIKLVAVFAAIPIAVIGFKRHKKALGALSLVLIVGSYGMAEMAKRYVEEKPLPDAVVTNVSAADYDLNLHGKAVYELQCISCHQAEGKGGVAGAKNLTVSQLTDQEIKHIVRNGKNGMAAYKKVLNDQEIEAVTAYVKSFRTE